MLRAADIVDDVRVATGAEMAWLVRIADAGTLEVLEVGGRYAAKRILRTVPRDGSPLALLLIDAEAESVRVNDLWSLPLSTSSRLNALKAHADSLAGAVVVVAGERIGALAVTGTLPFTADDERHLRDASACVAERWAEPSPPDADLVYPHNDRNRDTDEPTRPSVRDDDAPGSPLAR